jgi:hypothetical protein
MLVKIVDFKNYLWVISVAETNYVEKAYTKADAYRRAKELAGEHGSVEYQQR